MNELLKPNQMIKSGVGQPCKVIKFLGSGGQGEVYQVEWGGREFALKWYYQQNATPDQRELLRRLVSEGKPSEKFLWPEDLAFADHVPGYGYIMRLRPPEYKSLNDLVAGKIQPTYIALITAALELVKAFRSLHIKGLAYRDISFGNAFFNPVTGDVLICDNDNVATNRIANPCGVLGTPDFMAPEIVRGEAQPTNKTDLHSLSVLLFYIFCMGHPLMGKKVSKIRCWDAPARTKIFGEEPVFIFDPNDRSNEALDKSHDPTGETGGWALVYWQMYPKLLRDTFLKSFTVGLRDPDCRVTELEWSNALAALRDAVFKCVCSTPNFYDSETAKNPGGSQALCWHCKQPLKYPFRIRIGKSVVMLNADSKLYLHHMADGHDYDFSTPVAEVTRHPSDPNIWGLKNISGTKWVVTLPNGTLKDVEPGRSAPLASNTKIAFGKVDGEIRY